MKKTWKVQWYLIFKIHPPIYSTDTHARSCHILPRSFEVAIKSLGCGYVWQARKASSIIVRRDLLQREGLFFLFFILEFWNIYFKLLLSKLCLMMVLRYSRAWHEFLNCLYIYPLITECRFLKVPVQLTCPNTNPLPGANSIRLG